MRRVPGALQLAVDKYGKTVLSKPLTVANVCKDLLPEWPRETDLVVAGSSAGVPDALSDRLDRGVPPETAISEVAHDLARQKEMDTAVCRWLVETFAGALGRQK